MSFRSIDIDALEQTRWVDPNFQPADPSVIASAIQSRSTQVRQLLSKGQIQEALAAGLSEPPYYCDDEDLKNKNLQNVMDCLTSFRSADMSSAIQSLTLDDQDVLLKYLYRAMAYPGQFNSAVALAWHEKVVEINGNASILRVLTDRRTV